MGFSGDLESFSLADVFQKVQQNQETGRLLVDDGKMPFAIYFSGGKIRSVQPASGTDPFLDGVLFKRAGVDPKALAKAMKKSAAEGPAVAAWKAGMITDSAAKSSLEFFAQERAFDLFSLDRGKFSFDDAQSALEGLWPAFSRFDVTLDPGKILFEAARRSDEWKRIKRKIISSGEVFVKRERRSAEEPELSAEESAAIELLDGKRTVSDVVALSPESRFTVCKALSSLIERNLVKPLSPDDAVSVARRLFDDGRYEDAVRMGRKGLETERNNPDLRRIVIDSLLKLGEKEKAAGELKLLAYSAMDDGNFGNARKLYSEVIDLDPRDFDARERMFNLLAKQGDFQGALEAGQSLASAAREYGAPDKARGVLSKLIELSPDNPTVWEALAGIYERIGQKEEAAGLLRKAARAHQEKTLFDEARKSWERIVAILPEDKEARDALADIETGRADRKAKTRKTMFRALVPAILVLAGLAWIVWDWTANMEYARMTTRVLGLAAESKFLEAGDLCGAFAAKHPLTTCSFKALSLKTECQLYHEIEAASLKVREKKYDEALENLKKAIEKHAPSLPKNSCALKSAEALAAKLAAPRGGKTK